MPETTPSGVGSNRDTYRGVILILLAASMMGVVGTFVAGWVIGDPVLLAAALALGLSAGILLGVTTAQTGRVKPPTSGTESSTSPSFPLIATLKELRNLRLWTAGAGGLAVVGLLIRFPAFPLLMPKPLWAGNAAALCLIGAGLSAVAARYLAEIDPTQLLEAPGLCYGARVTTWIMGLALMSVGLLCMGQRLLLCVVHILVLALDAAVCYAIFAAKQSDGNESFPLRLDVLSILGSRPNLLVSITDAMEQQLGIDLRSTWAFTVIRRGLEPLVIGLCVMGWLSTSLTVVGVEEQGLVERLGVPVSGAPLPPGLHVHWPWPIDRVSRIPMQRVQSFDVGHAGEEAEGPENVLWAIEHAPDEYSLLLGNGRELVTMDAAVQFRIVDARAWRYHCQNPADALRAIAYRAVMRSTVDRTLSEVLSEDRSTFTGQMRDMVQKDADAMDLGVQIVGFTVGAMHPPVPVAAEYEAVVSAELGKVTATVNAQALRNQLVPDAEAFVVARTDSARAESAEARGRAAGEAWSFRTLEAQYHAAPREYFFRRRLETLENGLAGRGFIIIDSRIERDGGELWLTQ